MLADSHLHTREQSNDTTQKRMHEHAENPAHSSKLRNRSLVAELSMVQMLLRGRGLGSSDVIALQYYSTIAQRVEVFWICTLLVSSVT